jgi:hypothetical protein
MSDTDPPQVAAKAAAKQAAAKKPGAKKPAAKRGAGARRPAALAPHPLVVGLAATMFGDKSAAEGYSAAKDVQNKLFGQEPRVALGLSDDDVRTAVQKFVTARNRWGLVKFAGYLGDEIDIPGDPDADGPWQVLFLDDTADSYVGMRVRDVKFRDRIKEDKAAFGILDVVWVTAESQILTGGRMETLLARFTSGGFLRAGDFRTSMTGGTLTAVSELGPLCTSFTPCCCNRHSP